MLCSLDMCFLATIRRDALLCLTKSSQSFVIVSIISDTSDDSTEQLADYSSNFCCRKTYLGWKGEVQVVTSRRDICEFSIWPRGRFMRT